MNTLNAVTVTTDGTASLVQIDQDFRSYQKVVGGYIEALFGPNITLYMNEEGYVQGLDHNASASLFVKKFLWRSHPISGDVLILGGPDEEGNDTHVHKSVIDYYELEK